MLEHGTFHSYVTAAVVPRACCLRDGLEHISTQQDPNQHLLKSGLCCRSLGARRRAVGSPQGLLLSHSSRHGAGGKRALGGPRGSQGPQNPKSYRGVRSALPILSPPGAGLRGEHAPSARSRSKGCVRPPPGVQQTPNEHRTVTYPAFSQPRAGTPLHRLSMALPSTRSPQTMGK